MSFDEVDSTAHRDTILAGGENTNKSAAARICGEAMNVLAKLEKLGISSAKGGMEVYHLQRPLKDIVIHVLLVVEILLLKSQEILEEQSNQKKIVRRSNLQTLSLVMDNKQIRGITQYLTYNLGMYLEYKPRRLF